MFRWLERLVGHLRSSGADPKWVEPSNAITRAILAGAAAQLSAKPIQASMAVSEPVLAPAAAAPDAPRVAEPEETLERAAAAVPVTRTAQRSRRRRASRAA